MKMNMDWRNDFHSRLAGHSSGRYTPGRHQDALDLHRHHRGRFSLARRGPVSQRIDVEARGQVSRETEV